jgi:putative ABC transport system permease protein
MKTFDIVRRAGRSLKHAKARTFLTSLAIAVGAFTLTIAIAAGEGARQYANTLLTSNIDPQILAIAKDKSFFEQGSSGPQEYNPSVNVLTRQNGSSVKLLSQDDIDKIASMSDIESIVPSYSISPKYITSEAQKKYTVQVSTYDAGVTQTVIAGKLPELRTSIADNQIAIPEVYLSLLGFNNAESSIGKTVSLHLEKTPVVSQSQIQQALASNDPNLVASLTTTQSKDFAYEIVAVVGKSATELAATSDVEVSNNSAKALSEYGTEGTDSYHQYTIAQASVKDGVDPESVKKVLTDEGYGVKTAKDLQSLLFTIVDTLQGIVIGFGILALITSVFGIINTQYISVLERTREIGLMKALGMRGPHVSRLFQFEAAWIGFLGGTIGAIFATILGLSLNPWITDTLSLGKGNYILIFQPIPIVLLVVALMFIAMLAGYFPARKAAKLDPIEALRTE